MSTGTSCDDAGGGMGMPVGIEASLDGRAVNVGDTGGQNNCLNKKEEIQTKENGVKDAGGDTGVHNSSTYLGNCGDVIPVASPVTEVNGISAKQITSTRITSNNWSTEETEDDCIVDFLDKSNDKVHLSLSHP
jgi:hypothetical protein